MEANEPPAACLLPASLSLWRQLLKRTPGASSWFGTAAPLGQELLTYGRAEAGLAQVDFRERAPDLYLGHVLHLAGHNNLFLVVGADDWPGLA